MVAIAKNAKASVFQYVALALSRRASLARPKREVEELIEERVGRRQKATAKREADFESVAHSPMIGGWMHMG